MAAADPPLAGVLYVSGQAGGTRRCRCDQPMEQLALRDVLSVLREADDPVVLRDVLHHELLVLHRVPMSPLIDQLLSLARAQGKPVVFETDDLVFEPEAVAHDSLYRSLPPGEAGAYVDRVRATRETLRRCDAALTTTGFLADRLRPYQDDVRIHRNAAGVDFLRFAADEGLGPAAIAAKVAPPSAGCPLVIGYVSGSTTHDRDMAVVAEALVTVLQRHPHVRLRVVGPLNLGPTFDSVRDRISTTPLIPWEDVAREIAATDINLAPLEEDSPFCQAKSELKYIEAAVLGAPVVASRTDAFCHAITPGENGLLATTTDEWTAALERLIADPEARVRLAVAAWHDVRERYAPQTRADELVATLVGLREAHARPAETPRVAVALDALDALAEVVADEEGASRGAGHRPPAWLAYAREQAEAKLVAAQHATLRRRWARPLSRLRRLVRRVLHRLRDRPFALEIDGQRYELLGELTAERPVTQRLAVDRSGLHRIDVLFATYGRVNTPQLVLRVKDRPDVPVDRVTLAVPAAALEDNRFFAFEFDPLPAPPEGAYHLTLEAPDGVPGDAPGVYARLEHAGRGDDRAGRSGGTDIADLDATAGLTLGGEPLPGRLAVRLRFADGAEGEARSADS